LVSQSHHARNRQAIDTSSNATPSESFKTFTSGPHYGNTVAGWGQFTTKWQGRIFTLCAVSKPLLWRRPTTLANPDCFKFQPSATRTSHFEQFLERPISSKSKTYRRLHRPKYNLEKSVAPRLHRDGNPLPTTEFCSLHPPPHVGGYPQS